MEDLQYELKDDVKITILCCGEKEYYHLNYVFKNKYNNMNILLVKQKSCNEDEAYNKEDEIESKENEIENEMDNEVDEVDEVDNEENEIDNKIDSEEVVQAIDGSNMVFVIAYLGEENQLKEAAFYSQISREKGILTLGIIIKPSHVDSTEKRKFSNVKMREIKDELDSLFIVDREKLAEKISEEMFLEELNIYTNKAMTNILKSVVELISNPGLVDLKIEDLRAVMKENCLAYMGIGSAKGSNRAFKAAKLALSSPLLLEPIHKASGIMMSITAGEDIELLEINEIAELVQKTVCKDVPIIFGTVVDNMLEGEIRVSITTSGYKEESYLRVAK